MQHIDTKTLHLRNTLGAIIRQIINSSAELSCNQIENEYDIGRGTISRIGNGKIDCKFITLWKISEATGIKLSEIIKILEDKLGPNFTISDD